MPKVAQVLRRQAASALIIENGSNTGVRGGRIRTPAPREISSARLDTPNLHGSLTLFTRGGLLIPRSQVRSLPGPSRTRLHWLFRRPWRDRTRFLTRRIAHIDLTARAKRGIDCAVGAAGFVGKRRPLLFPINSHAPDGRSGRVPTPRIID